MSPLDKILAAAGDPMTSPLLLGVPSAGHRKALLRETAGGGRVPVMSSGSACAHHQAWCMPDEYRDDCYMCRNGRSDALILSHPTDPEAGAMGLARLAWVAAEGPARWEPCRWALGWRVWLHAAKPRIFGSTEYSHDEVHRGLTQATSAVHAIGLVCVHLGFLERVERVEVPHGAT